MLTIKNIRPGILVIPDAGLRLAPGAWATNVRRTGTVFTGVVVTYASWQSESPFENVNTDADGGSASHPKCPTKNFIYSI